jgi:hypothetical protein
VRVGAVGVEELHLARLGAHGRNFSPARNVRSITAPSAVRRSFVRTNAPALAGLDVLELEDLEDRPVDLDVVAVLELVGGDAHVETLACLEARRQG